ncbi:hypothetical protein EST38_g13005 [Candolleomyces aberdarensis]|uniref:Nucleoplasmin-like domain-containing protein n=1 Tax=Candolleomyces aberdarensis TaxID=2316362 RepID=A0A4Q2D0Z2_9AGAR|nr:hypothetical protein EST38_g13005 [Candolleomyces aberdarensis]
MDFPEIWMLNLSGNEEVEITPPRPLSLTNVSLAALVAKEDARTSLVLAYVPMGSETETSVALATLFKNRSDNHMLMVNLSPDRTYVLRAEGPNNVDIVGYFPFDRPQEETDSQVGDSEEDESKTENEASTRAKETVVKEEVHSAGEETSVEATANAKTSRKAAQSKAAKSTRSRPATTKRTSPAQDSESSAKAGTLTSRRATKAPAKKPSAVALGKRKVKE